jgi:hypothetical protein
MGTHDAYFFVTFVNHNVLETAQELCVLRIFRVSSPPDEPIETVWIDQNHLGLIIEHA